MASDADDDDEDAWIPCDLCDTQVRFRDYAAHAALCGAHPPPPPPPYQVQRIYHQAALHHEAVVGMMLHDIGGDGEDGEDGDDESDDEDDVDDRIAGARTFLFIMPQPRMAHPEEDYPEEDYEFNTMLADLLGRVETGVSDVDAALEELDAQAVAGMDADARCPICYDELREIAESTTIVRTVRCKHSFCDACIRQWLQSNARCPVCMAEVSITSAAT